MISRFLILNWTSWQYHGRCEAHALLVTRHGARPLSEYRAGDRAAATDWIINRGKLGLQINFCLMVRPGMVSLDSTLLSVYFYRSDEYQASLRAERLRTIPLPPAMVFLEKRTTLHIIRINHPTRSGQDLSRNQTRRVTRFPKPSKVSSRSDLRARPCGGSR
jgi:hypothetical protein